MADSQGGDGSIAPRRSLGGPILPPPSPEMIEEQHRREQREKDAAAAKQRAEAERKARHEAHEQEKAAKERAAAQARQEAREQARLKSEAREKAKQEKAAAAAARTEERNREREQRAREKQRQHAEAPARAVAPLAAAAGTSTQQRPAPSPSSGAAAPANAPSGSPLAPGGRPGRSTGSGSRNRPVRRTRRAQLRLVQVDAWSVMKTSFLLSIALGIVLVVAVAIIWSVLGAAGVWDSINQIVQQAVGTDNGTTFDIQQYVGASRVLGFTMIVAVLDVILITAIATLGAFLYNLSAALLGGVEVTLAEDS